MLIKKMKVQEIAGQIRGVSYKPEDIKSSLDNNSVILLRANNIDNGRINFDEVIYVDKRKVSENQYLQRDDILICTSSGSRHLVGKAASVDFDKPCTFGAFCRVIRPQSNIGEYLGLYFQSNIYKRNILKSAIGANINNIRTEHISSLELPVYDYKDRMKIIRRIRLIQSIIFYRQTELVALDKLIKARFVEMFGDPTLNPLGWRIKRFDEISENLDSRRKPITSSERKEGIYPYYGASGIVDYVEDYIFDEDILLISEDGANLLMRSTPIAFSVSGKVWVNNHAHVVRFKDMSMQNYVEKYFSLIDITGSITGSAQPKLNQSSLNAMLIPIPEKRLLDSYLDIVKQVNKSKVVVQKALDEAQTLFDSLMQEYFG